jgi:hypothetical protein
MQAVMVPCPAARLPEFGETRVEAGGACLQTLILFKNIN